MVGRACVSMCFLASWMAAARAGLKDYAVSSFGYCSPQEREILYYPIIIIGWGMG